MTYTSLGFIQSPAHTAPVPGARPLDAAALQHIEQGLHRLGRARARLQHQDARRRAVGQGEAQGHAESSLSA